MYMHYIERVRASLNQHVGIHVTIDLIPSQRTVLSTARAKVNMWKKVKIYAVIVVHYTFVM